MFAKSALPAGGESECHQKLLEKKKKKKLKHDRGANFA
jgi:hypothetical protein